VNKSVWFLLVVAVSVLAALYLWVQPAPPRGAAATGPVIAGAGATVAAAPAAAAAEFEFDIAQGKVRGPPALQATAGQRVTLRVRSDIADELHVHGYDLSAPVPANEPVALTFIAAHAGRFEIELHHANLELGALEVQP
jgi:hypothetical protein